MLERYIKITYFHKIFQHRKSHLLKKSDARWRCRGKLSKLSVSTGPCIRVILFSDFWDMLCLADVITPGVLGVLMPMDGVLDDDMRRGDGVLVIRSFWVANLLAAGDIVLKRSIVDLGDGLKEIIFREFNYQNYILYDIYNIYKLYLRGQ